MRLAAQADTNFSAWHTAVISDDGKKVVFTDEWGGGTSPMCQANSMMEMGGNAVLTLDGKKQHVLAQPSKNGFLYVLDRASGKPLMGWDNFR